MMKLLEEVSSLMIIMNTVGVFLAFYTIDYGLLMMKLERYKRESFCFDRKLLR